MTKDFDQPSWNELLIDDCRHLIRLAAREDLDQGYDWTTVALVPELNRGTAHIVSRDNGVAAGIKLIPTLISELECDLDWTPQQNDGDRLQTGSVFGVLDGSARDLLTVERMLLNFVGHLSGVATLTATYVERIDDLATKIYDTRKTLPGYRRLEKYAVRCGGGHNHRSGLFDAILIKDNHLAFGAEQTRITAPAAVEHVRRFLQESLPERSQDMVIEIEVDTLLQLQEVLPQLPDIVLLDNMSIANLTEAVTIRDRMQPSVQLEASGGVNEDTVRAIASTGVDRISVGALTHSAKSLDVGLDWQTGRH